MTRTWVGFVLLVLLLIGGLLSISLVRNPLEEVADLLESAAGEALSGNLSPAADTAREAHRHWEKVRRGIAAVTDHSPLEQIDRGFTLLKLYASTRESQLFAAVCAELAMQIRAVCDAHNAQWQNIL